MSASSSQAVYLKDYQVPSHYIETVALTFRLDETATQVNSQLRLRRNPEVSSQDTSLQLQGESLTLIALSINGRALKEHEDYVLNAEGLLIHQPPQQFDLTITTEINPKANTALEGLYLSSGRFCTQCEAHGFRRITYYLDRPDVLARFTTTVIAEQSRYPVLLSNGNLQSQEILADGLHQVTWVDPHPKPAYLFALVAGDLACKRDQFITKSGREVALELYVLPEVLDRTEHAMNALKKSMAWDEQVYQLEYDLDVYMIVAVNDFNMGAMENKGLNVFNDKYILADQDTATDHDFLGIETVVAHEYFHNWTGNRVTCRDWFQLSLKEGLTVYRDQEFTADVSSRAVRRIEDVNIIRTAQFTEDAGPMAHPIRPHSYVEMNNFYTVTVYNKGAEVIRMIATLLGEEEFFRGMELYIARHDGKAVTTDDFVQAMADANDYNFSQFLNWYSQAGTPEVTINWDYNQDKKTLTLSCTQTLHPSPGQPTKAAYHIPIRVALIDQQGNVVKSDYAGQQQHEHVLSLTDMQQQFVFKHVGESVIPSVFRNFSAPVKMATQHDANELLHLLKYDTDAFAKWDAGQTLMTEELIALTKQALAGDALTLSGTPWITGIAELLAGHETIDHALLAHCLQLPSLTYLADKYGCFEIEAMTEARSFMRAQMAAQLADNLLNVYQATTPDAGQAYVFDKEQMARRALRNKVLYYLMFADLDTAVELATTQYQSADNMTERFGALACLAQFDRAESANALADFYQRYQDNPLVIDKWLSVQATSERNDVLEQIQALCQHEAFKLSNPNKVYALLLGYAKGNLSDFHQASAAGYRFIANKVVELDSMNPQVAAKLVSSFLAWRRFDAQRQAAIRDALTEISQTENLSKNVGELVEKALKN